MNGKHGDNPLSDLTIHGKHPFPPDIEQMLLKIAALGRRSGRWPLGENWPFSIREFQWQRGEDLDGARRDLAHFISMLEVGRGDEIMIGLLPKNLLDEHLISKQGRHHLTLRVGSIPLDCITMSAPSTRVGFC